MSWRVTVRIGPEGRAAASARRSTRRSTPSSCTRRAASNTERRETVDVRVRRYEAGDQVAGAGRAERARRRASGVDVRGDGGVQAWTGPRAPRRPLELEDGETPFEALRRVVVQSTSVEP